MNMGYEVFIRFTQDRSVFISEVKNTVEIVVK